jgi:hypothetical protein
MSVGGQRKRSLVRKLAAEPHQKPKERTREYCGSRKRVTVAGKGNVSRCVELEWRKKPSSEEYWEPGKLWTAQEVAHSRNKGSPLCKSGTEQRTGCRDKEKRHCT